MSTRPRVRLPAPAWTRKRTPPPSQVRAGRRHWLLRSLRWAVLVAAVAATVIVAKVAFPASPPEPPRFGWATLDVTGDVRSVDYTASGLRVWVTLAVARDANDVSLQLDESGSFRSAALIGDIPEISSGTGIGSDNCWRVVKPDGWPDLERSAAAKCADSNKVVLSWWSQSSGTSGPYAWAYVPPMQIAVDRRNVVANRFVDPPPGPDTTLTSEFNLDVDPTILAFHLHTRGSFSLHSAKLFAATSDDCVGVANSDVVSSWSCSPPFAQDTTTPTKVQLTLPAAYSVYERDGYEATREVMLLVLGALLGLVGGGVYTELHSLAPRKERKSRRS